VERRARRVAGRYPPCWVRGGIGQYRSRLAANCQRACGAATARRIERARLRGPLPMPGSERRRTKRRGARSFRNPGPSRNESLEGGASGAAFSRNGRILFAAITSRVAVRVAAPQGDVRCDRLRQGAHERRPTLQGALRRGDGARMHDGSLEGKRRLVWSDGIEL